MEINTWLGSREIQNQLSCYLAVKGSHPQATSRKTFLFAVTASHHFSREGRCCSMVGSVLQVLPFPQTGGGFINQPYRGKTAHAAQNA